MRRKDDQLWKGILEDLFDDFLRFMHPDADAIFDFNRGIEFLDKELDQLFPPEDNEYAPKLVDKLAKVYRKDGREEWVLIHIEVQGLYRKDFGSRMFRYYYRILDKYDKPITAYAIFTESNKVARPNTFKLECLGTSLQYRYNTYKIAGQDEDELRVSNNPFAVAVLVAKLAFAGKEIKVGRERDELLYGLKMRLSRDLLKKKITKDKIYKLMTFLRYYVLFESSEINHIFDNELKELTERSETMGIEELMLDRAKRQGIQKGLEKGILTGKKEGLKEGERKKTIETAIEMKKDGMPAAQISRYTKLTIEEIEKL